MLILQMNMLRTEGTCKGNRKGPGLPTPTVPRHLRTPYTGLGTGRVRQELQAWCQKAGLGWERKDWERVVSITPGKLHKGPGMARSPKSSI